MAEIPWYNDDDDLSGAAWLQKHGIVDSDSAEKPEPKTSESAPRGADAPVKREATEDELSTIYAESSSPEELRRRLAEAGMPQQIDGMPLNAHGQVDADAPRYNASGQPENEAAWDAYRAAHPDYVAAEAEGPREVVDSIGRVTRTYG